MGTWVCVVVSVLILLDTIGLSVNFCPTVSVLCRAYPETGFCSFSVTGSVHAIKAIVEIAGESCLEQRDAHNRTALTLATMGGHGELVNHLLAEGGTIMFTWAQLLEK